MVLKRCVYGVDKNPMAVELAKVALWLHTFTVGAPLSFLDHHLRCGDSLFGAWVRSGMDRAADYGSPLLLHDSVGRAARTARAMQEIEGLTDAEIAEAQHSAETFAEVEQATAPLNAVLSLVHALDWLNIRDRDGKAAVQAFFSGTLGDPIEIALGDAGINRDHRDAARFAEILAEARRLIAEERFLHWQVAFPGVWSNWESAELKGGFDAVIGNPPWDQMRLEQVEWFAARRPEIAMATRTDERRRMIAALEKAIDPLAETFKQANKRAKLITQMARNGGDYPLLSGTMNLYSLFVERSMFLVNPDGMVGVIVPSGIASDKYKSRLFRSVAITGRLKVLYDFENRRNLYNGIQFFSDVDDRFKFCVFVASSSPLPGKTQCAFFLQDVSEIGNQEQQFTLEPADFNRVNPNFGTAPVFRSRKDAELTTAIYGRLPVLEDRSRETSVKIWPVKYIRMFDMSEDSSLFRTEAQLESKERAWPIGNNRFKSLTGIWVPLYQGMMVQAYDHRAASVSVNASNLFRPGQPSAATQEMHNNPSWLPIPQYWVNKRHIVENSDREYFLTYKRICSPTNHRTMIAAIGPLAGYETNANNLIFDESSSAQDHALCLSNFNSIIFDYVVRQKIQGQTLNLFILEQLPVVPPERYDAEHFGSKTAAEIVRAAVLELTYTAHDMAPFARDMGHVDEAGDVLPPFVWDDDRRLYLRAKLDALFFHLYGVTDRDDVRYIYSTFPIVERQETKAYGGYRSRDLCLAWMNALDAGDPDAEIAL